MEESALSFSFDPKLAFFLKKTNQEGIIQLPFRESQTYKHLIESLGVPHTEVGRIFVNGIPESLDRVSKPAEFVIVEPVDCRENQFSPHRFILDNHLGRLCRTLRLLGLDCLYDPSLDDEGLAAISAREERFLLTRDRQLLMRSTVTHGYSVRSMVLERQLDEIFSRFNLLKEIKPFGRCAECNTLLVPVDKAEVIDRLEPLTRQYFDEFHICQQCDRIYWKGSHYHKLSQTFQVFLDRIQAKPPQTSIT
jgi:uncharacterized protein